MAGRKWAFLAVGAALWESPYFCDALALAELPPLTIGSLGGKLTASTLSSRAVF